MARALPEETTIASVVTSIKSSIKHSRCVTLGIGCGGLAMCMQRHFQKLCAKSHHQAMVGRRQELSTSSSFEVAWQRALRSLELLYENFHLDFNVLQLLDHLRDGLHHRVLVLGVVLDAGALFLLLLTLLICLGTFRLLGITLLPVAIGLTLSLILALLGFLLLVLLFLLGLFLLRLKVLLQRLVTLLHPLKLLLGSLCSSILVWVHLPGQLAISIIDFLLGCLGFKAKVHEVEFLTEFFQLLETAMVCTRPFQQSLSHLVHQASHMVRRKSLGPRLVRVHVRVGQGVDRIFAKNALRSVFVHDDGPCDAGLLVDLPHDRGPPRVIVRDSLALWHGAGVGFEGLGADDLLRP
mmetsp:Transcript_11441/g.40679  ORF Transcript_11441/g.40679 Transcript_11441/m.40679 type:complete len:352 (-) Transcript_11441:1757-2812(-)